MIIEQEGNMFDHDDRILCHQVNCMMAIGGGISGQFILNEPNLLKDYQNVFINDTLSNVSSHLGEVIYTKHNDQYYASIFGQKDYGCSWMDGKIYTDYNALKRGMINIRKFAENNGNISIAFPYGIGCGLSGGSWDTVKQIIDDVFCSYKGNVTIYKYNN